MTLVTHIFNVLTFKWIFVFIIFGKLSVVLKHLKGIFVPQKLVSAEFRKIL